MNISRAGEAIHDDFYTVAGSDFPPDAVLEFDTDIGVIPVPPDFLRPHLILVKHLPTSIPVGAAILRVTSVLSASSSNDVAVAVTAGPPLAVRVLHAGEDKQRPYTVAVVANPALSSGTPAAPVSKVDPILTRRVDYHRAVGHIFDGLFKGEEDLLRECDIDARMRLVSVFPAALPAADEADALVAEGPESSLDVLADRLVPFLAAAGEIKADMVALVTGSTTNFRAAARPTIDDADGGGVPYRFDGVERKHGRFPLVPGGFVISAGVDPARPSVLHEFCHAASEFNAGWVTDINIGVPPPLFADKFLINIKYRAAPADAVPADFADYNGTVFRSNPTRAAGLPYPAVWRAYHPRLVDGSHRNLMDDYNRDPEPLSCRLDGLTRAWLRDRLKAKLTR